MYKIINYIKRKLAQFLYPEWEKIFNGKLFKDLRD